jgi:hypothetical protein
LDDESTNADTCGVNFNPDPDFAIGCDVALSLLAATTGFTSLVEIQPLSATASLPEPEVLGVLGGSLPIPGSSDYTDTFEFSLGGSYNGQFPTASEQLIQPKTPIVFLFSIDG